MRFYLKTIFCIILAAFFFSGEVRAEHCADIVMSDRLTTGLDGGLIPSEVKVVTDPGKGLAAKLVMIRRARETIALTSYIFEDDESGALVLDELEEALKRGVTVRVMVDSLGSFDWMHKKLRALYLVPGLQPEQLQLSLINPATHFSSWVKKWWRGLLKLKIAEVDPFFFNSRSHDKLLLVDAATPDALAMIGGRNIANTYYGLSESILYEDIEVILRPLTMQAQQSLPELVQKYYNMLFFHFGHRRLQSRWADLFSLDLEQARAQRKAQVASEVTTPIRALVESMEQDQELESGFQRVTAEFVHEVQNLARFYSFFSPRWRRWMRLANPQSVIRSIKSRILRAQSRVQIVTPFFLVSPRDIRQLHRILRRRPDLRVEIITNSMKSTDVPLAQMIFDYMVAPKLAAIQRDPAVGARLKIFTYEGRSEFWPNESEQRKVLHAKLVVVDEDVLITSSNFDFRSQWINSEVGVWFHAQPKHGEAFSAEADVQSWLSRLRAHSTELRPDQATPKTSVLTRWWRKSLVEMLERVGLSLHL